jgi:predicted dehydrogenase
MSDNLDRRHFLGVSAASGLALGLAALPARAEVKGANEKIIVGVMGTGGRGLGVAAAFENLQNVEVAYVCDVDRGRVEAAADAVSKVKSRTPKTVTDFRRILDDGKVDLLVVTTCNHWHAPAAILACAAGKHVYVEKPCSHNPREGELLVEASRKHKRQVQMGNQRRSWPGIIEAVQKVRDGVIGRPYLAESFYQNNRPSIGKGKTTAVPEKLDYDLWQGPAPRRPFRDNYLHYSWHWFWHWGNGELGNNGIHMLDLCRWGLGVDYPIHVASTGGRYRYEDDQETPDTHLVSFSFEGRKTITWEGLSCNRQPAERTAEVIFYGEKGCLAIAGNGYTIYDEKGKEVSKVAGTSSSDALHFNNLLDGIRSGKPLHSEIEEGHKSTLLCHLGNISQRIGRSLRCDPRTGKCDDKDGMALWSREYEKGWEPKV